MRPRIIGLALVPVAAALALGGTVGRAQGDPAGRAVSFLVSHQQADGSVDGTPGETEDFVLGAAAAGFDPSALGSVAGNNPYDFLSAHFGAALAAHTGDADAGHTAKLILAVRAGHLSATGFGGIDLIAHLTTLSNDGVYGSGDTFTQALAVLALRSAGQTPPAGAVAHLIALENGDGSWNFGAAPGAQGDTNSTAIALQALAAAGNHGRDRAALAYLHREQNADGGFPYQSPSAFGTASDPSSDAIVLEALVAARQDPLSAAWARGGGPVSFLASTQDASGGLRLPGATAPDAFTTSSAVQALALQPLPVVAAFGAGSGPSQQTVSALRALRFLVAHQSSDGSFSGDPGVTEDTVIGTAAAGYDPATLRTPGGASAIEFLAANVPVSNVGRTAKLAIALDAAGIDPAAFAGHDLIAEIRASYAAAQGSYGDGSTFGQAYAILALSAEGDPVPAAAVARLAALQDRDGGWNYTNAADSGPASDTNSTSLAIMALAAAGEPQAVGRGVAYLHHAQTATGGFGYDASSGADPDSDALVLQAMTAAHQDPAAASWTRGGGTAITSLLALQDGGSGGYAFGTAPPDAFTTSQVPAGIERAALPVRPSFAPGASPGVVPGPPVPAPSPGAPSAPAASGGPFTGGTTPQPSAVDTRAAQAAAGQASPAPSLNSPPSPSPASPASPSATPSGSPPPLPGVVGGIQGAGTGPGSGAAASPSPSPAAARTGGTVWWVRLLAVVAGFAVVGGGAWFSLRPRSAAG